MYWRPGCPYCTRLRLGRGSAAVPAEWVNIWEDQAAVAALRDITGGDETVPTVVVGTKVMVNPSALQVIAAVRDGRPGIVPAAGAQPASWLARAFGLLTGRARQRYAVDRPDGSRAR